MNNQLFDTFIRNLQDYFSTNDFTAALAHIEDGYLDFPDQGTILDFWRIILHARQGDPDAALAALEKSINNGNWFSEVLLRRSPSLQTLQGEPRFERLIAQNQQVAEADRAAQFPYYVLRPEGRCKDGGPPCAALIGLHASGGSVATSLDFWKIAASLGWLSAALQSSQALMKGVFIWDDLGMAEADIQQDYSSLTENYRINPWQIVLAGHGTSAEIVLWLILTRKIEINKFLIINPSGSGIQDLDKWKSVFAGNQISNVRGYILVGEWDESVHHNEISDLVELLVNAGAGVELEVVNGVDENYQPLYDGAVARALNYLSG